MRGLLLALAMIGVTGAMVSPRLAFLCLSMWATLILFLGLPND